jgi:hypothetical protein
MATRKRYSASFKAQVALQAYKGESHEKGDNEKGDIMLPVILCSENGA